MSRESWQVVGWLLVGVTAALWLAGFAFMLVAVLGHDNDAGTLAFAYAFIGLFTALGAWCAISLASEVEK